MFNIFKLIMVVKFNIFRFKAMDDKQNKGYLKLRKNYLYFI